MFTIDKCQLTKLSNHFARLEKRIPTSIAGILNSQADGTRNAALEMIRRGMNVRAPSFISSRIRYTRATPSSPRSEVGSIATERFTALEEQERGGMEMRRDRGITKAARRGDVAKKVMPAARMRKAKKFLKPSEYRGAARSGRMLPMAPTGRAAKARGMIRSLSRSGYRKPFIVEGSDTLPAGLYILRGRRDQQRLVMLQQFGVGKKVGRRPWMRPAIDLFFRRWYSKRDWSYHFGRYAKRFK